MYRSRDIFVFVKHYVYVTSGPSLLTESIDFMVYVGLPQAQQERIVYANDGHAWKGEGA